MKLMVLKYQLYGWYGERTAAQQPRGVNKPGSK